PRLQDLLQRYRKECRIAAPGRAEMLESISLAALVEIVRILEAKTPHPATRRNQQLVNGVIRYLSEHLAQSFTLGELAYSLNLSPGHTARIFKQETGHTVFQHLKHMRVEKAATLLTETHLRIHEVAR